MSYPGSWVVPETLYTGRPGDGDHEYILNIRFHQPDTTNFLTIFSFCQGNVVFHDDMLINIMVLLVKAVPWPPRLMLSWITPVSHIEWACIVSGVNWIPRYGLVGKQSKTHVHLTMVQNTTWCQDMSKAPYVSSGLVIAVIPMIGGKGHEYSPLVTKADDKLVCICVSQIHGPVHSRRKRWACPRSHPWMAMIQAKT